MNGFCRDEAVILGPRSLLTGDYEAMRMDKVCVFGGLQHYYYSAQASLCRGQRSLLTPFFLLNSHIQL